MSIRALTFERHRSVVVFSLLAILILFPLLVIASPDQTETWQDISTQHKRYEPYPNIEDPDLLDCETPLAGDLYGLGVRLGVYFNWFTAWVASNFIPDEISGALDSNAIFLLAIVVSAFRSIYSSELMQIDALILLELCAGTVVGVLSLWGYRTCWYRTEGTAGIRHFGGFGTHLRLLLATAVAGYSVWFWTDGIEGSIPVNNSGDPRLSCDQINVLTLDVNGPVQYIALALGSLSTLYCGTMLLASSLAGYTRFTKVIKLAKQQKWASSTRLRYYTGLNDKELHFLSKALGVFDLMWIIFAMLFVELTLNQNKVRGVLGENGKILEPAQLLPMLIGAFSFVRILFIGFELWRNPHDIAPSLGHTGSHLSAKPRHDSLTGLGILKLFSPSLAEDTSMALKKSQAGDMAPARDQRDDYSKDCRFWQRLLVAWLPWISLLDSWPLKDYKGLPVTETESPQQKSGTHSVNTGYDANSHDDNNENDEKNQVNFEDALETMDSKGKYSDENAITLPRIHHVGTWSPVDMSTTDLGSISSLDNTMAKPQAVHFEEVSLETPISPVGNEDISHVQVKNTVSVDSADGRRNYKKLGE